MAKLTKKEAFFAYLLGLADDHLILAQNALHLVGKAPVLEEELAGCNTTLDWLGTARQVYAYAGEVEAKGRSEDDLAFLRQQNEYLNIQLVEQPNIDFAHSILRQFLFSSFYNLFWTALEECNDETLVALALRAKKETAYQQDHAALWLERLGQGTDESHDRLVTAANYLSRFTGEFFVDDETQKSALKAVNLPNRSDLQKPWRAQLDIVMRRADISFDEKPGLHVKGREGRHTEHLGHLLTDMQFMQRSYPGLEW